MTDTKLEGLIDKCNGRINDFLDRFILSQEVRHLATNMVNNEITLLKEKIRIKEAEEGMDAEAELAKKNRLTGIYVTDVEDKNGFEIMEKGEALETYNIGLATRTHYKHTLGVTCHNGDKHSWSAMTYKHIIIKRDTEYKSLNENGMIIDMVRTGEYITNGANIITYKEAVEKYKDDLVCDSAVQDNEMGIVGHYDDTFYPVTFNGFRIIERITGVMV